MSFWNFMRDMMVFDWLFGHRKKENKWEPPRSVDYHDDIVYSDYSDDYSDDIIDEMEDDLYDDF